LGAEAKREIKRNLKMLSVMGCLVNVMEDGQRDWIVRKCEGSRLIVFDTLSRIHQLDENSNGDMSRLMGMLEHIAKRTGASVLYLHHARWCGFMAKMGEDEAAKLHAGNGSPIGEDRHLYVRFGVSKQNHGEPIGERWYKRNHGGILTPAKLEKVANGYKTKRAES
jgi:hypothetical protein